MENFSVIFVQVNEKWFFCFCYYAGMEFNYLREKKKNNKERGGFSPL